MPDHLFDRLLWAKQNLAPVQSQYRIVWEDPDDPDAPARITVPDPNWMAAALHGGILPPIESYIEDRQRLKQSGVQDYKKVGGARHPYANPISAMTEMEAIKYLLIKDCPEQILTENRNRPYYMITSVTKIPKNRLHRNAWQMSLDEETPIDIELDKAKAIQRKNMVEWFISSDKRRRELEPYIKFSPEAEQEYINLSVVRADIAFDRLDRAKTLSDLDRALPGPLVAQYFTS